MMGWVRPNSTTLFKPVEKIFRLGEDRRLAFLRPTRKRAVGHGEPGIIRKAVSLPDQKLPVEVVERAGVLTRLLLHVVCAPRTKVRHSINVGAGRGIGLGRHLAAIRKNGHSQSVRHLNPLEGVGVDGQIPALDIARGDACQQGEISRDHQTLDVVRAVLESGRTDLALYTGNDDNLIADLLTPFRLQGRECRIVGGLLGHWAVAKPHSANGMGLAYVSPSNLAETMGWPWAFCQIMAHERLSRFSES